MSLSPGGGPSGGGVGGGSGGGGNNHHNHSHNHNHNHNYNHNHNHNFGGGGGGGGPSSSSFAHFHNKSFNNRKFSSAYMNTTATTSSGSLSSSSLSNDDEDDGDAFTSAMRDRQARGKDPYNSGDGSEGSDLSDREGGIGTSKLRLGGGGGGGGGGRPEKEDYASRELRQKAIAFLDNPELLMMYAQSTGDSIPGARLHFMRLLCGYDDLPQHSSSNIVATSGSRFANRPDHPRQQAHNIGEKRRR
ncbi:hypothetical protein QC762_307250 [Podospora pseudocomata]|uniref:Uncharacterized protein n=1 Tax=Podospora pseudocomata TaxID=2093779 RepID=A0ABR0GJQ3_9PEZI|nr:hypothetical protein QC762_307250 [Podospora pseudocomata]